MRTVGFTPHQLVYRCEALLADALPSPAFDHWPCWDTFLLVKDDITLLGQHGVKFPFINGLPTKAESVPKALWWLRSQLSEARRVNGFPGSARAVAEKVICDLLTICQALDQIPELKAQETTK